MIVVNINASLIVQMLVFIVFIGLTMKFIWPPIVRTLETRRKNIADSLAAAEKGNKKLEVAEIRAKKQLIKAKAQATHIIEQANQHANHIVEEAKNKALEEGERLFQIAKNEIQQEYNAVRAELLKQISTIAMLSAQKILQRAIDTSSNDNLVNEVVGEI